MFFKPSEGWGSGVQEEELLYNSNWEAGGVRIATRPRPVTQLPLAPGPNSQKLTLILQQIPSTDLSPPRETRHLCLLPISHLSISHWQSPGSLLAGQSRTRTCGFQCTSRGPWEYGEGLSVYRNNQHSEEPLAFALRKKAPGSHCLVC